MLGSWGTRPPLCVKEDSRRGFNPSCDFFISGNAALAVDFYTKGSHFMGRRQGDNGDVEGGIFTTLLGRYGSRLVRLGFLLSALVKGQQNPFRGYGGSRGGDFLVRATRTSTDRVGTNLVESSAVFGSGDSPVGNVAAGAKAIRVESWTTIGDGTGMGFSDCE